MKCDVWQRIGRLARLNPGATLFPYLPKIAGGRHATRYWLAAICALWGAVPAGSAATVVHDFYLPMPEAQIRQTFTTLESGGASWAACSIKISAFTATTSARARPKSI